MDWLFWGLMLAAVALLIGIILKRKGGTEFFRMSPIKNKVIVFASPQRIEMILLFCFAVLLLWWDVLQNKLLDRGMNVTVTWFGNVTSPAIDLAYVILFLFHLSLMALFVLSLQTKNTNRIYDLIVGTLALFGVAILLSGFINSLYAPTIRFLGFTLESVSYYHVGIIMELMAGLYWSFTK